MGHADELIIAGSRPTSSNPIDALHSRTSTVLLVDSIVLFIILYSVLIIEVAAIPAIAGLFIWSNYKKKAEWAYWFAPLIIGFTTFVFSVFLFLNIYHLLSGTGGSWLIVLLIGWATISGVRFIRIHFHPVYRLGYSGNSIYNEQFKLPENEMLASCPTCLAVLAVNPMLLSPEDRCPHCDNRLVLSGFEEE